MPYSAAFAPPGTLRGTVMLRKVLTQGTDGSLFFAHNQFEFLIKVMNALQIPRTEQLEEQRRGLCQPGENIFDFGLKAVVF